MAPSIGLAFDREYPAGAVVEFARTAEASGVDQLWVIEDCFFTAGVSLAAAALTATDHLTVGLGIMPAVARNPAITAMEIATLCGLAPGRFLPGIGHGVQAWMAQMGARPASPLTTLEETLHVVRRLLAGERVDFDGTTATMRDVALHTPPDPVPPVLAGVRKPKSLDVAGRAADGIVLAEGVGPTAVRAALAHTGRVDDPDFRVAVLSACDVRTDGDQARANMAGFLSFLVDSDNPGLAVHPDIDRIRAAEADGVEALAALPAEVWHEIAAVGTPDDALAYVEGLDAAGVDDVAFFVGPEVGPARRGLFDVAAIARAFAD